MGVVALMANAFCIPAPLRTSASLQRLYTGGSPGLGVRGRDRFVARDGGGLVELVFQANGSSEDASDGGLSETEMLTSVGHVMVLGSV